MKFTIGVAKKGCVLPCTQLFIFYLLSGEAGKLLGRCGTVGSVKKGVLPCTQLFIFYLLLGVVGVYPYKGGAEP